MSGFLKKTIQISLILVAFLSIANVTAAQELVDNSVASLSISTLPTNPRTGDSVILTVSSNLLDLNSAKIIWYIDGVARKDTTSKSITIKTKSSGDKTSIRVVVETTDGIIKEASKDILPAGVNLILEPVAYTMPFYKGKPFFISMGTVRIVAMPDVVVNGSNVSSKDLNFTWIKNGVRISTASGKGKDSITLNGSIPVKDFDIGIQISDDSGNILTESSKTIFVNDPKILFYENSPLYGILYNLAITGSYYLGTREELKIDAKPFSFSFPTDSSNDSSYVWYVNGDYVPISGKINEILFRQTTTNLKGNASVSLDLKNTNRMFQSVSAGFNIGFGQ
jgi:hypothetical protein